MEPLIDNVVRKLHHLPQPKLHEVLNFVEFLTWQEERSNQLDIGESTAEIDESIFEDIADQLSEELAKIIGTNVPLLSDCAVSHADIYEEHP
ncbi:hypothetical protein [Coleofasciculus sp. FACHB-1120]|uniref:hypothetical protein n=1 Tax=Coleofasciculus sp. FACHB-1120 TaxID=2692783 RepID=UPI001685FFAC|nr:hypothetical protein [Coleofasciculus sp. FACHB-1120]MBD2743484.1 hypothetical protein [Coleofasciculus sp. FACHB-1120]